MKLNSTSMIKAKDCYTAIILTIEETFNRIASADFIEALDNQYTDGNNAMSISTMVKDCPERTVTTTQYFFVTSPCQGYYRVECYSDFNCHIKLGIQK
ncbi:hypothetical protein GD1_177 [Paraglaciecola Antarctic GD virus 1]|nr:hypothetical protein GD1_177 [Paraglaciecola Antarctic GD virus 1]